MKHRRVFILLGIAALLVSVVAILCVSGTWIPNQPSQVEYPVRGIDVSHYQGDIHWDAVAAANIRFAYIKATEGADYIDPSFQQNWDGASAAHVARGHIIFT
jgi:lysozyme